MYPSILLAFEIVRIHPQFSAPTGSLVERHQSKQEYIRSVLMHSWSKRSLVLRMTYFPIWIKRFLKTCLPPSPAQSRPVFYVKNISFIIFGKICGERHFCLHKEVENAFCQFLPPEYGSFPGTWKWGTTVLLAKCGKGFCLLNIEIGNRNRNRLVC